MIDLDAECKKRGYVPKRIQHDTLLNRATIYVATNKRLTQATLGKWWDGDEFEVLSFGKHFNDGFYFCLKIKDRERER